MRGRAVQRNAYTTTARITPAYAGKRNWCPLAIWKRWDHPRVCGEEKNISAHFKVKEGSPPRMRGRVPAARHADFHPGITPAYAGKSPTALSITLRTRDHPRVCGEEQSSGMPTPQQPGSPPRMRGRAWPVPQRSGQSGITPAYAGKSASA